jgi:hypothetical protein
VADEAGSHTRPDAAGGEAGHGAAKLDPVIHRYVFLPLLSQMSEPRNPAWVYVVIRRGEQKQN